MYPWFCYTFSNDFIYYISYHYKANYSEIYKGLLMLSGFYALTIVECRKISDKILWSTGLFCFVR